MLAAACAAALYWSVVLPGGAFMNSQALETATRRAAAAVSRRSSFLTLGGAALAATMARPDIGEAKKKGKNCKKKEKQRCNNDTDACISTLTTACMGDATCIAELTPCCETCSANGFLTCFIAASP
jgi:hypothetical protein